MKKLFLVLAFLLCPSAWATTTVTGHIANLSGAASTSGTFARFTLRGCAGNQPRVNGVALIAPTQGGTFYIDFAADASGNISGTLYSTKASDGIGNGEIQCGTSFTGTWYGLTIYVSGKGGPEIPVAALNTATLDVTTATPLTTNPVATAPTGDSTYARLDGGNQPFTGNVTAPNVTATTAIVGATVTATGLSKGNQLQSTVATGTAPLVIASTTNVPNLNASSLAGATFAAPGAIGGTTPGSGNFTSLSTIGPNVLKGLTTVKNFEQIRYVDDANTAGWAGADVCAQEVSAEADLPSYGGTIDMRGLVAATFYSCTNTWAIGSGKAVVLYLPSQDIVITPSANTPVITVNSSSKILGVNGSNVYTPGGSSRLQSAGSGTGDFLQWTGSLGVMEDVGIVSNNTRSVLHLLASGSNNVLRNNFRNINISGGTAGEKCVELTADSASALVSHNVFEALKTNQCDVGMQLDTSGTQGPTDNYFYASELESTLTLTAAIKITSTTTASNHFIGGHTSGTGPSIVTAGTANTFEFLRTEASGVDVNDTGTGNSFIGDSFGTNCTTSTFAASAVLLGGWSNTNCPFDQFPRGVSVATAIKLGTTIQNGAGTSTMGLTLKKGTGAGNYASASTTFVAVDGTNLTNTVTIPTGWKLSIQVSGAITTSTAIATAQVGINDGACSGSTTNLQSTKSVPTAATNPESFALLDLIAGDGASHTINLCYLTGNAADSVTIFNASADLSPRMVFTLMPSN